MRPRRGPNFFVVGAAKSGTTALYHALRRHPDVYLPATKEPHFYAYLAEPAAARHLYADEAAARRSYRALYAGVTDESAVGDASTTNLVVRGAAAAIAADAPAARIVAILRHPVDRAFSHWCHFRAAGGEELGDFEEALRQERARQEAGFPFTYQYLGWSRYSTQLPGFYEHFGRERVLVHLYDDLCRDPGAVVRDTLAFLGVDGSGPPPALDRHNEMPVPRFPALQRALRRRGRLGSVAAGWAGAHLIRRPELDPGLRAELTEQLGDELARLEELIGRDLSAWR